MVDQEPAENADKVTKPPATAPRSQMASWACQRDRAPLAMDVNRTRFTALVSLPDGRKDASMTTPNADQPHGMSYVDASDIEWDVQTPSSRRKVLRFDDDLYVAIVRWDAGYELPLDEHGAQELIYVLEGTFVDENRSSGPGTIIRAEAGSSHQPSTPDGVTFLVVRSLVADEHARIAASSAAKGEPAAH
ncbi:MAG: hypothetical protein NVSMB13_01350 [Mycobacteriales bacterium]